MPIKVTFVGALVGKKGMESRELASSDVSTAADVLRALSDAYGDRYAGTLDGSGLLLVLNGRALPEGEAAFTKLEDGDELSVLIPMAGGRGVLRRMDC